MFLERKKKCHTMNFFKHSRQRRLTRFDNLDDLLSRVWRQRQLAPVASLTKEKTNSHPTGQCECENESKPRGQLRKGRLLGIMQCVKSSWK
ncbi:hypothetical protein CDAR_445101 [Caerostris darwini]|uniref:Uncharacterized protein n=1 Tax=Caerostris darwini TaxID=1538125 RepID=A0AAV4RIG9_9ARAC|nr:hypothetical protein CDAR_445101 [Caerostris darwini]